VEKDYANAVNVMIVNAILVYAANVQIQVSIPNVIARKMKKAYVNAVNVILVNVILANVVSVQKTPQILKKLPENAIV